MLLLLACTPPCPFSTLNLPKEPVSNENALKSLLIAEAPVLYPELEGIALEVEALQDLAFFRASATPETLGFEDTRARTYLIQYDPVVLSDPPEPIALAAILSHELAHVAYYLTLPGIEMAEFGIWYGTEDPMTSTELAAFERGTDEQAMLTGAAEGLSVMRKWIYEHSTPEIEEEKRRNYYTPEEIMDWVAKNGECGEK
jgi:hypothetical protein